MLNPAAVSLLVQCAAQYDDVDMPWGGYRGGSYGGTEGGTQYYISSRGTAGLGTDCDCCPDVHFVVVCTKT